ncbi:MAG: prephenate dehydrogenase/arogenate dehydrogenase family protein [Candidatus Gastranaerophilales bacterium]|nr:prephenate dehydrogenase/arogenate dehydrogenase family protein [Candidatus Gastranaerophilales bacterium]
MKIGIIGLGLIGGSILKKLSNFEYEIYAVTGNEETAKKVHNLTAKVSKEYDILTECELVFVCTPIRNTLETLDKLENIVGKDCVVTDVASVKEFVTKKKRPYKFIPSHPMAGTEKNGYDASFEELFTGAKWVVTPYDYRNTEVLEKIIRQLGAETIIADAKEHDKAVAIISHLPMYVSQCLFASAKDNPLAMKLASSGFRDTTRLAATNTTLAMDMLEFNGANIEEAKQNFEKELNTLKDNYCVENLQSIKQKRQDMYSKDGKNVL